MTVDGWINLFEEDEKYFDYAKRIYEYVKARRGKSKINDEIASSFEWSDISTPWYELNKMMRRNLIKVVLKTNAHTCYAPVSFDDLKEAIKEYKNLKETRSTKVEIGKLKDIPEDMFHPIVGFDDIKQMFIESLKSEKPVHICLIGPPATAKSLFLLELARLYGSYYAVGSRTSGAGLSRILFDKRPRILLIDEIDKMASNPNDLSVLLSLMETGRVIETKATKIGEIQLDTRVYAAGNSDVYLPNELKSRFTILYLREYTDEEFLKVTKQFLIEREDTDPEIAEYIAKKVISLSRDVRQARNIARMCKDKKCVDNMMKILQKYRRKFS